MLVNSFVGDEENHAKEERDKVRYACFHVYR